MSWTLVVGQNQKIDSLKYALANATEDKQKVDILHDLTFQYWDYDFDEGYKLAKKGLELSQKINYKEGVAKAQTSLGLYYYFKGDYEQAMQKYRQSLRVEGTPLSSDNAAYTLTRIGNIHRIQSKFDSAIHYYNQASRSFSSKTSDFTRASVSLNQGLTLFILQKYDSALGLFQNALRLSKKTKDSFVVAETWKEIGRTYIELDQFDSAQHYLDQLENLGNDTNNPQLLIFHSIYMGELYLRQSEYASAIKSLRKSITLLKDHDFKLLRTEAIFILGKIFSEMSEYDAAVEQLFEAERLNRPLGTNKLSADILYELGYVYYFQQNPKAKTTAYNAQKIYQELGIERAYASTNTLLGTIYIDELQYDSGVYYYNKCLSTYRELNYQKGIAAVLFNLSFVFIDQGNLELAYKYQIDALLIEEQIQNRLGILISYNSLGSLLMKMQRFKEAESYLIKAKKLLTKIRNLFYAEENARLLASLYSSMGSYKKAAEYYKESKVLSDSLYRTQSLNKTLQLSALNDLEKKEMEILQLSKDKEVQEAQLALKELQLKQQSLILWVIGAVILAFFIFILVLYRTNKKLRETQDSLVKSEKRASLGVLSAGLSHELNNPLNFIKAGIGALKVSNENRSENENQIFAYIEEGVDRTSHILRVLSQFQNQTDFDKSKCDLRKIVSESVDSLRTELREGIELSVQPIKRILPTQGNEDQLKQLFIQVIRNALQSIDQSGKVNITYQLNATQCLVTIDDDGTGISPEHLMKVQDPFFTTKDPQSGKGLGLYIADYIMTEHQGTMRFDPKEKGTKVVLTFPRWSNLPRKSRRTS
jgi:signal transduction histidine kinase